PLTGWPGWTLAASWSTAWSLITFAGTGLALTLNILNRFLTPRTFGEVTAARFTRPRLIARAATSTTRRTLAGPRGSGIAGPAGVRTCGGGGRVSEPDAIDVLNDYHNRGQ